MRYKVPQSRQVSMRTAAQAPVWTWIILTQMPDRAPALSQYVGIASDVRWPLSSGVAVDPSSSS